MTKRLQVLLDDEELAEIQRLARRRHQTTAAWVRDALRTAREASQPDVGRKLRAVREAASHAYPTGDIDEMLADIERGYGALSGRDVLVDSNIPMYLVGAPHPNKVAARKLLERAIADGEALVTDAEVVAEILHRYVAIDRRDAIEPAMAAVLDVVDEVFPVERLDVERAARLVSDAPLSARDALHGAVMQRRSIDLILTFDRGFDAVAGITRYSGR